MPDRIALAQLKGLLADGVQLVDVLPPEEYAAEHLPGAVNVPLKQLDAETTAQLDQHRPVAVYCYDALCDMSPRAAWRLETLGFERVYHYVGGKADWLAHALPREGQDPRPVRGRAGRTRATDLPAQRQRRRRPRHPGRLPRRAESASQTCRCCASGPDATAASG
jgi:rhodanese-related sulfurtransferase